MTTVTDIPQKSRWKRILTIFLVPVLVLGGLATSALFITKNAFASDAAGAFISGTNSYRAGAGLDPVELDGGMSANAQAWAQYMADNNVYEHDPNGGAGMPGGATKFGENIDKGVDASHYMYAVDRWYSSPGHQANILDPEFTHMGAGYAVSETGEAYAVQTFASVNYTPPAPPAAPSTPVVNPNEDGTVTVSWDVLDAGSHEISETEVAQTINGNTTIHYAGGYNSINLNVDRGVENTFAVRLNSQAGTSGWSPVTNYTLPVIAPSAPEVSINEVGTRNVAISVSAYNGGAEISSYTLTLDDGKTLTTNDGYFTFSELERNTTYSGTVYAVNSAGIGEASPVSFTTAAEKATSPLNLVTKATGGTGVHVSWDAPADNGGADLTYNVSLVGPQGTLNEFVADRSANFDVIRGDVYEVSVTAENIAGVSPAVTSTVTAPITAPAKPTNAALALGAEGQLIVSWEAPADNGGAEITGYKVNGYVGDDKVYSNTVDASQTFAILNELDDIKANTEYRFEVAAINSQATSEFVTTDAVKTPKKDEEPKVEEPGNVPGPVDGLAIDVYVDYSDLNLNIFWNAPVEEEEPEFPVIGYQVDVLDGEELILTETLPADTTSIDVPVNKAAHIYTIKVTALNAAGSGEVSEMDFETPKTVPSAPRGVTVEPAPRDNTAGIKISWNVPVTNGGSDVTRYMVNVDGDLYPVTDETSLNLWNLKPTTEYNISVVAENEMGESASVEKSGMSSMTSPTEAQNINVESDADKVTVTWDAPANDGSLSNDVGVEDYIVALYQDGELIAQPSEQNFFTWFRNIFVDEEAESVTVTGRSIEWSGMKSGDYTVSVRARNIDKLVSNKVTADFTVTADAPKSYTPENLEAKIVGGNNIQATWDAPTNIGDKELVEYAVNVKSADGTTTSGVSSTEGYTFNGLAYETEYTVSVKAVYADDFSSDVVTTKVTTDKAPKPAEESLTPENVKVKSVDKNVAIITWDVPKETGTKVLKDYTLELSATGQDTIKVTTDALEYQFDSLAYDTIYSVVIRSNFVDGSSSADVTRSFKTDEDDAPVIELSLEPENLEAKIVDNNNVDFTWDAPKNMGDKKFEYYSFAVTNLFTGKIVSGSTQELNHSLTGLEYYTNYNIILYANYEGGERSKPVIQTFQTGENPEPVSLTPENVKVSKSGKNDALMTWDAPKQPAGKIVIGYTLSIEGGREFTTIDNSFLFEDLKDDTLYTFTVRAEFSDYTHSDNVKVEYRTDKGEGPVDPTNPELSLVPENLKADKSGHDGALLTWDAPKEIGDKKLKGYIVSITLNGDTRSYSTTEKSYKFTKLAADTLYTFTVKAEFEDGTQSDATAVDFKTLKVNPPIIDIGGGTDNGTNNGGKGNQGGQKDNKVLTHETPEKSPEKAAQDATERDADNLASTGAQNTLIMQISAALLLGGALVVGVSLIRKRNRGEI